MNNLKVKIDCTIMALRRYMAEFQCSFEDAIKDWDQPWSHYYLWNVVYTYRGEEPTDDEICKLAGVNEKYWPQFKQGLVDFGAGLEKQS